MLQEKIYNISPVWLQNLMCSAKGYLIHRRRYNKDFLSFLDQFEAHKYQTDESLYKILHFCQDVPFYKENVPDEVFNYLSKDNVYSCLEKFPIISKQVVKEHFSKFHPSVEVGPTTTAHTSGTTGSGLVFPYTIEMENKQWAVWWRYRRALGIELETWCGWLGGRSIIPMTDKKPPFWRINKPGRQIMYSSYHLNSETIALYHKDITDRKLTWMHGYPSSASILSSLIIENGLKPIECVKWITTGAENLLEHQVNTISRAFPNAIVRTHYGLTEGVANFSQSKDGKWHIDDDFAYVEFIPLSSDDNSVCKIVGTGFFNKAFPLIRYDTGDLAKIKWIGNHPEIIEIYGRQEDYIELPNGVKLGRLDHIFKDCVNIKEAQIHQIRINLIELRIVKEKNYSITDEKQLLKEASSRFGDEVEIKITYCNQIERTKAGKVRFIVSDL